MKCSIYMKDATNSNSEQGFFFPDWLKDSLATHIWCETFAYGVTDLCVIVGEMIEDHTELRAALGSSTVAIW